MTVENIIDELKRVAEKTGKMGNENVSATFAANEVNTELLPDWMMYELESDGTIFIICEAENLY